MFRLEEIRDDTPNASLSFAEQVRLTLDAWSKFMLYNDHKIMKNRDYGFIISKRKD